MEGKYRKVHLFAYDESWAQAGEGGFPFFDLPFGRAGMLAGCDLIFPESADSLAKLGTDILCAPALWGDRKSKFIWEARLGEQMHLAVANQWGEFGKFHALGKWHLQLLKVSGKKAQVGISRRRRQGQHHAVKR